jgi:DNA topoisomerase-1
MMDQQSFEATRPVSADPAVALAEALGQLPKEPVKLKPSSKLQIVGKTSVEDLARTAAVPLPR